jgi:hypothetical protein
VLGRECFIALPPLDLDDSGCLKHPINGYERYGSDAGAFAKKAEKGVFGGAVDEEQRVQHLLTGRDVAKVKYQILAS